MTDPTRLHDLPADTIAAPCGGFSAHAGDPRTRTHTRGLDAPSVGLVAVFTALLVAAAVVPGRSAR